MRSIRFVRLAAALSVAACGGGDSGGPPPPPKPTITVVSGDAQTGPASEALPNPLVVRVDLSGVPDPGVTVSWTPSPGAGTVTPTSSTSGADGTASTVWTAGTAAGAQRVQAAATGAAASVSFGATVLAGPAAAIAKLRGDAQTGRPGTTLATRPVVRVTDALGNPVAGVTVQWLVTAGGGSPASASGTTNAAGLDSIAWTLGPADGANTLEASAAPGGTPLTGSPLAFHATAVTPTLPMSATVQVQSNFFQPSSVTIGVGGTVTWNWIGSDHSVTPVLTPLFGTPGGSGVQNAGFTYGPITFATAGTYRYICTVHGGVSGSTTTGMAGTVIVQ